MFIKCSPDKSSNEKELQNKYVKYGPTYVKKNPTKHNSPSLFHPIHMFWKCPPNANTSGYLKGKGIGFRGIRESSI